MKKSTTKIIHIINHTPAYKEYEDKQRPTISWDTPNGSWVGIWRYDWADQIASEILKVSDEFEHEVWQPDLRADRIYSYIFDKGLIHRMFPAIITKGDIFSPLIVEQLLSLPKNSPVILLIPPVYDSISLYILQNLMKQENMIIIATHLGEFRFPIIEFFKIRRKAIRYLRIWQTHLAFKKALSLIDGIVYTNNKWIYYLKKIYSEPTQLIPCGVDFKKWKKGDKLNMRKKWKLPLNKSIILSSSRLSGIKQIDKLLKVISKVHSKQEFLFIIAGHGTGDYEAYLKQIAKSLLKQKKVMFIGYVSEEELVEYYQAADIFINTSLTEGSPVSVQKAFACELPVITTDVGYTAEILKKNNAGVILPIRNYQKWEIAIQDVLDNTVIRCLDLQIARTHFEWTKIAEHYINFINLVREHAIGN